jgi:hypothetical protein
MQKQQFLVISLHIHIKLPERVFFKLIGQTIEKIEYLGGIREQGVVRQQILGIKGEHIAITIAICLRENTNGVHF